MHLYKPKGTGIGLGDPLPGSGAPVLQKESWAAAIVDELVPAPEDLRVDKYRISCLLVSGCCATSSPDYCTEATAR
jgi:nicotinamidase-related amidase